MRALLDVNVLIALLDAAHVHHGLASQWLEQEIERGWASCPITQNGCIRIMSQPGYPEALAASEIAGRLAEAASGPAHQFIPDDLDMLAPGAFEWSRVLGHRQLTDTYLLALAVRHGARFITFDKRISTGAVSGAAPANLVCLLSEPTSSP